MNDLRVINLSSYATPKIIEYRNKEWIAYGEDNNYFKYLIFNKVKRGHFDNIFYEFFFFWLSVLTF